MMINLNRHGESITGSVNGKSFGVSYTESKWKTMNDLKIAADNAADLEELQKVVDDFELQTKENYKEYIETKCPDIYVSPASGKFFLKHGGFISTRPIPSNFAKRILESLDLGIDPQPLIKAWTRFLRNPRYCPTLAQKFTNYLMCTYVDKSRVRELMVKEGLSEELAIERATVTQTPISIEGLLCSYKVSAEQDYKWALDADGNKKKVPMKKASIDELSGLITYDELDIEERIFKPVIMGDGGDAFWCGDYKGHVIKVGQVHKLDSWDQVQKCGGPGLHIGNLSYIECYQKEGTVTHETFVDPMHIGDISGSGDGALVCLQYFTHRSFVGVCKTIYHSSTYAALTDKEWADMKEKAVEAAQTDVDDLGKYVEELNSL
jgi:hypothetical protein